MAEDEIDLEALMKRSTSEVDREEAKLRGEIIAKGRKLAEAVEKLEKNRLARDSAVASYEESQREVEAAQSVWRKSLADYSNYTNGGS